MNKQEIIQKLNENYSAFNSAINTFSDAEFEYSKPEKWSAGQQLKHLVLSVKPLTQALLLPGFVPKILFGKANRPGKSFDELVSKYLAKIEAGGKASGNYVPSVVYIAEKEKLTNALDVALQQLTKRLNNISESDLDVIILPHPLLGKLTLREMLYFTIYHAVHHTSSVKKGLL